MLARKALEAARAKIADVWNWEQWCEASDSDRWYVEPLSPDAVQWDALGALGAASFYDTDIAYQDLEKARKEAYDLLCQARDELFPGYSITKVNRQIGHKSVLKLYDRAIELAPKG